MTTIEDLLEREANLKRREAELQDELSIWKNRCLSVEEKVKEVEVKVSKFDESNSEAPTPNGPAEKTDEINNLKRIIEVLYDLTRDESTRVLTTPCMKRKFVNQIRSTSIKVQRIRIQVTSNVLETTFEEASNVSEMII